MTYGYITRLRAWLLAVAILAFILAILCVAGAVEWLSKTVAPVRLRARRASVAASRRAGSRLADVCDVRGGVDGLGHVHVTSASRVDARSRSVEVGIPSAPMDVVEGRR